MVENSLSSAKENTDPKIASALSFYYHNCQQNLDLEPHNPWLLSSIGLFSCCLYSGKMHYHPDPSLYQHDPYCLLGIEEQ